MLPTTVKGYETLKRHIQRQKTKDIIVSIFEYIAIAMIFIMSIIKF